MAAHKKASNTITARTKMNGKTVGRIKRDWVTREWINEIHRYKGGERFSIQGLIGMDKGRKYILFDFKQATRR